MSVTSTAKPVRQKKPASRIHTFISLARAEITLLVRNRMQLFNGVALPVGVVFLLMPLTGDDGMTPDTLTRVVSTLVVLVLVFVVFYNLLSTYVARREELVLKRLRTGEAGDALILAGTAAPAVTIATLQTAILVILAKVLLDVPWPANPLLLAIDIMLGAAVLTLLALMTAMITKTVESVQVTSLPILSLVIISAGLAIPLGSLPDPLGQLFTLLPGAPIADLARLGWIGTSNATQSAFPEALPDIGLLCAWAAIGSLVVRSRFRWEPRT